MSNLGTFAWSHADQFGGAHKLYQQGGVVLPLAGLHRANCILETTRHTIRDLAMTCWGSAPTAVV
jgi:type I restriction-modification system DNA methylase subunit